MTKSDIFVILGDTLFDFFDTFFFKSDFSKMSKNDFLAIEILKKKRFDRDFS